MKQLVASLVAGGALYGAPCGAVQYTLDTGISFGQGEQEYQSGFFGSDQEEDFDRRTLTLGFTARFGDPERPFNDWLSVSYLAGTNDGSGVEGPPGGGTPYRIDESLSGVELANTFAISKAGGGARVGPTLWLLSDGSEVDAGIGLTMASPLSAVTSLIMGLRYLQEIDLSEGREYLELTIRLSFLTGGGA